MAGRRDSRPVPRELREKDKRLYDFLEGLRNTEEDGTPPGFGSGGVPGEVSGSSGASSGSEDSGWAAADHTHALDTSGTPGSVGVSSTQGAGPGLSLSGHEHRLGILAAEGDLLTHDGVDPVALPIGDPGNVLLSDGQSAAWGAIGVRSLWAYDEHEWRDQFLAPTVDAAVGGSLVGTQVGTLGWRGPLSAQVSDLAGEAAHPGIVQITSGTATGVSTPVSLGSLVIPDIYQATALVRLGSVTASAFRFGLLRTLGGTGNASRGHYFAFAASVSPNWFAVTRGAGGITATDTGIAVVAGDWYLLEMYEDEAGQIDFYVNGAGPTSNTTNLETLDASPAFEIETESGGNAKGVDLDLFWMATVAPLGSQFP